MAVQTINIGNIANDGTGDDLRAAFVKVNSNFTELDQRIVVQADGTNIGTGTGIFYVKDGNTLQFKSLVAGSNVSLNATANEITISAPDPIKTIQFDADVGSFTLTASGGINFVGGQNIDTSITSNNVTFSIDGDNLVQQDTSPTLGGNLDGDGNSIVNLANLTATGIVTSPSFVGNLTGLVYGHDFRYYVNALGNTIFGTDFGAIDTNLTTGFELMFANASIDYGTITSPSTINSDFGTITDPL